jgi:hypothetical protein
MQGALTGQEATNFVGTSNPLVKFHGCMQRKRSETLWTQGQLAETSTQQRVLGCSNWMNLHLPGKHLVVVGFWTDWGYLNNVLADAFTITNARSVMVLDPTPSANLQTKAPQLWDKLTTLSADFEHVEESGDSILEEIRTAYSMSWARRFYSLGRTHATAQGITHHPAPDTLASEDLYNLRRDAEGVPYTTAAKLKAPSIHSAAAAFAHIRFTNAGAAQTGAWLTYKGRTIRVVNGAGRVVEDVRQGHLEPGTLPQPDIVLCAGATDFGVPARLIASGSGASIVSPAPGGSSRWLNDDQALAELGI